MDATKGRDEQESCDPVGVIVCVWSLLVVLIVGYELCTWQVVYPFKSLHDYFTQELIWYAVKVR